MIVTAESSAGQRVEEARKTLERIEPRIRELRDEEVAASGRRDYAAATWAARARMRHQELYDHAVAVILQGGRKK